jgi:hypothetical protein
MPVTSGDRRCIRHGLLTEEATRTLAATWERHVGIDERLRRASERLLSLTADVDQDSAGAASAQTA